MSDTDIIDRLAGIAPGSALDAVRRQRAEARKHAQASFDGLFSPVEAGGFGVPERWAVSAFVAALHNQDDAALFYAEGLTSHGSAAMTATVAVEAKRAAARGPFGRYPPGPLSREDTAGIVHRAEPAVLRPWLATALDHAHMLVFHPRDAAPEWLQRLVTAGWTTAEIVTLSQLVAFLSFQIRVVAGLRALSRAMPQAA
jgi:CMD domain protein